MTFSIFRAPDASTSLPRNIHLRRAHDGDEATTFEVMRKAMGYEMNWQHHAPTRRHLRAAPDSSFWLAEETALFSRPRVVGYAHSMVRERVWSLTEFFVLPTHHRQGVGGALLKHCVADGDRAQADTRMVLASHHPSANALYIRQAGCFPRVPMLLLSGPAANLRAPSGSPAIVEAAAPANYETPQSTPQQHGETASEPLFSTPLILTTATQQRLDELDRAAVGYARPTEHALWTQIMGGEKGASRLFYQHHSGGSSGEIVGYAYFGPHCSGPACAISPEILPSMLAHVAHITDAQARSTQMFDLFEPMEPYWAVAGTNERTLRWLLSCGWHIVFQYQLMCTRPLGQLDRYACHNPLYML